ncbi:MAG TPA: sulfite exporter TauE/SafE family protein [Chloroflexia bacterium]|nr:sulfite exporter TauE/SafE family protein [Chloroflexia bacterium]
MSTIILALVVGAVTGLMLGLVGGGGSILTVPALIYLLGQGVGPATTISLVVVGANAAFGGIQRYRHNSKAIRLDYAFALAATGLIGAQAGNWLNRNLPDKVTLGAFALLMLLVAGLMLRPPRLAKMENVVVPALGHRWVRVGLIGLGLGFMTGLFGVGGGFLIVPALVLLLDFPMSFATGTSLVVIALNSLSALLGRWPLAGLDLGLALTLIATGFAGTWLGGKLAHRMQDKTLRIVFAWMIVALSFYIGARVLL